MSSVTLLLLCLAAVCGTDHNTVYLHHGSGRLAARMTPYTLLLVLREKHGLQVMVDRGVADAVSKYFTLPRRLAVMEVNIYTTLPHWLGGSGCLGAKRAVIRLGAGRAERG